jgi:hypothetical protein
MPKFKPHPSTPNYLLKNPIFTSGVFNEDGTIQGYIGYKYKGTKIPANLSEGEYSDLKKLMEVSLVQPTRHYARQQLLRGTEWNPNS